MKFFFDNNLPPKLAKSLHLLVQPDHEVVHLKDRFAANASDEEWMRALAKEKSMDHRVRRSPNPKEPACYGSVKIGSTHNFFSQTGLDQSAVVDTNMEIREMLSGHTCDGDEGKER